VPRLTSEISSSLSMIPGPVAGSLKGMSDSGPTTAAADALANDKETPTSPSAGTTSFRPFRGEACFVFGILQSSKPMLRRCRVGFGPACGKAKPRAERCGRTKAKITKQRKSPAEAGLSRALRVGGVRPAVAQKRMMRRSVPSTQGRQANSSWRGAAYCAYLASVDLIRVTSRAPFNVVTVGQSFGRLNSFLIAVASNDFWGSL
jgi:hypothetical protein